MQNAHKQNFNSTQHKPDITTSEYDTENSYYNNDSKYNT